MTAYAIWMLIGQIAIIVICVVLFNWRVSKSKKDDVSETQNDVTEINSAPIKNSKKV